MAARQKMPRAKMIKIMPANRTDGLIKMEAKLNQVPLLNLTRGPSLRLIKMEAKLNQVPLLNLTRGPSLRLIKMVSS